MTARVVGYTAIHQRLLRRRGRPDSMQCVDCGQTAGQWAYTGDDPNELRDPKRFGLTYSLDLDRYEPKCRRCHLSADAGRRRANKPPKPPTIREKSRSLLTDAVVEDLRAMHSVARHVNGATPEADPARAVSVEFTQRLAQLVADGALMNHLDLALGIAIGSVNLRLRRHGVRPRCPSEQWPTYSGRQSPHIRKARAA